MKKAANPGAWNAFTQDFHKPSAAAKRSGTVQLKEPEVDKKGNQYLGTVDTKGKFEGWGVLVTAATGEIYQGEFTKGKPNGSGALFAGIKNKAPEGTKISGDFKNGKISKGRSRIEYPDGSVWSGDVANNMKNGQGVFTEKSGAKYEGIMKGDKKVDKKAKYIDAKGNIYEGGFKNNLKDGKGKAAAKGGKNVKYNIYKAGVAGKEIDEAAWKKG